MGLILTRREGQEVWLYVEEGADPAALLDELKRGIQVRISHIQRGHVGICFCVPPQIKVARQELLMCKCNNHHAHLAVG